MANKVSDAVKKLAVDLRLKDLGFDKPLGRGGFKPKVGKIKTEEFDGDPVENKISSSLIKALAGSIGGLQTYHLPADLIGGSCPRVVGEEENIVWNAAAEATDSERVHVVWQAVGGRIWYLAVRSNELASNPHTWCPFASLLPGMKDATTIPACYTFYSDEAATMMTVTAEGLQIHRGTASVIRAKAERMVRDLGDAPVIELIPDTIEKLTPVPWYSLSLFEDRARRILAATAVFAALLIAGFAAFIWLLATMSVLSQRAELTDTQTRSQQKSLQLMQNVTVLKASPLREQIGKFTDLNDGLISMNGFLEIYQIEQGKLLWRAILPTNITSDRINEIGAITLETVPQGVVVGNSREVMNMKGGR